MERIRQSKEGLWLLLPPFALELEARTFWPLQKKFIYFKLVPAVGYSGGKGDFREYIKLVARKKRWASSGTGFDKHVSREIAKYNI